MFYFIKMCYNSASSIQFLAITEIAEIAEIVEIKRELAVEWKFKMYEFAAVEKAKAMKLNGYFQTRLHH